MKTNGADDIENKICLSTTPTVLPFSNESLEICLGVLQQISESPEIMDHHDRFKSLVTKIHKQAKRQKRQANQLQLAVTNRQAIESTTIVRKQLSTTQNCIESPKPPLVLSRPRNCYVCKKPFSNLHDFYHQLCLRCANFNLDKRQQRANLHGRVALVTGGRVKIGYQTVLKLLRDGASVIATTRFPVDAASRFQAEEDFGEWNTRLQIYPLELRDIPAVEAFADELLSTHSSLDILIHNAAQTVKRPLAFYRHLLEAESNAKPNALIRTSKSSSVLLESRDGYRAQLSNVEQYFPKGWMDPDGQQVDQRPLHSWLLKLEEVPTLEMLEVYLVNAAAPFVLTGRLKQLLCKSPHARRFIVNVSAMEGQFSRENKTAFHPHTNMAKAALNMLTRTSAEEFAKSDIYMNSVDTGWITDEKPLPLATRVREEHGFYTPLDVIDGASRVYDPIASGCNADEQPIYGQFLKDYQPFPW